jgi:hypothetical protein
LWIALVEQAQAVGEIPNNAVSSTLVDEIMALIESLSIEVIIDPHRMTIQHQLHLVERLLERLANDNGP